MGNNTFIKNTATLFLAMAVTKIVGALFKIPLANILGGIGMGYFSTAYSIYSPVFAITAAGVPTVMIRLTAQNIALGRNENARRVKSTAIVFFTIVGLIGTIAIWCASGYFSQNVACSPQSRLAIIAIAPAVLFCCIASVIRGYYEGMSNVIPTAAANITEAVSRAVIGLALSCGIIAAGKHCFDNGIPFLGKQFVTYEQAYNAALPLAAAAAILSVTISEVCGLIALIVSDKRSLDLPACKDLVPYDSKRSVIKNIIKNLMPIACFALVMNCFSFVDLLTVTRTIDRCVEIYPDYYARAFRDVFTSGVTTDELANFMYGSYTGIAMSLFMLIPSFAGMTEKTAIPEITAAWERQDSSALGEKTSFLIKACSLIGFPASFGAAALAEPILSMLYPSRNAEVAVCVNGFKVLALGGMFMIITSALSGVFQAIGKGHIPLIIMAGAVIIKLIINPILTAIPQVNITGAAISTVICYAMACTASIISARRYIKKLSIMGSIKLPFLASCACAAVAYNVFKWLCNSLNSTYATIFSVISGGVVYLILLITTGFFRTSLIIKHRNEKKSSKGLAKKLKIG